MYPVYTYMPNLIHEYQVILKITMQMTILSRFNFKLTLPFFLKWGIGSVLKVQSQGKPISLFIHKFVSIFVLSSCIKFMSFKAHSFFFSLLHTINKHISSTYTYALVTRNVFNLKQQLMPFSSYKIKLKSILTKQDKL